MEREMLTLNYNIHSKKRSSTKSSKIMPLSIDLVKDRFTYEQALENYEAAKKAGWLDKN